MNGWIGFITDTVLIIVICVGIAQAIRLIQHLKELKSSRSEMERFVRDFNAAVMRAEAGVKSLRSAARESGDDLEKLVEKATMVRDELNFIVESADSVAERLSVKASSVLKEEKAPSVKSQNLNVETATIPESKEPVAFPSSEKKASSRAEQELLQALRKL